MDTLCDENTVVEAEEDMMMCVYPGRNGILEIQEEFRKAIEARNENDTGPDGESVIQP